MSSFLPTIQQTTSPLMRLPAEIRNTIYAMALTSDKPLVWDPAPPNGVSPINEWKEPGLTMVNKQLRSETLKMFWRVNKFAFRWSLSAERRGTLALLQKSFEGMREHGLCFGNLEIQENRPPDMSFSDLFVERVVELLLLIKPSPGLQHTVQDVTDRLDITLDYKFAIDSLRFLDISAIPDVDLAHTVLTCLEAGAQSDVRLKRLVDQISFASQARIRQELRDTQLYLLASMKRIIGRIEKQRGI